MEIRQNNRERDKTPVGGVVGKKREKSEQ